MVGLHVSESEFRAAERTPGRKSAARRSRNPEKESSLFSSFYLLWFCSESVLVPENHQGQTRFMTSQQRLQAQAASQTEEMRRRHDGSGNMSLMKHQHGRRTRSDGAAELHRDMQRYASASLQTFYRRNVLMVPQVPQRDEPPPAPADEGSISLCCIRPSCPPGLLCSETR